MTPDCAICGGAVESDGARETCTRCGNSQRVIPPKVDRPAIRTAVRESRRRRLLGPSCLGRLHHRCTASGCECTCHPDRRPREVPRAQA